MTDYYLGLGYGQTYSVGKFSHKPSLPLTDVDLISDLDFYLEDDPIAYEPIVQDWVENLEEGDSLTIVSQSGSTLHSLRNGQKITTFRTTNVKSSCRKTG